MTTKETAHELVREWQDRLHLQNWEIVVFVKRHYDFESPKLGENRWVLAKRQSIIRLLDPQDYDPTFAPMPEMELTVIHELLHCHFAPFDRKPDGEPESIAIEQAIHTIARTLLALKRQIPVIPKLTLDDFPELRADPLPEPPPVEDHR